MSIFSSRFGLVWVFASVVTACCLGGRTVHAQAEPVTYWIPGWPLGFGSTPVAGQNSNTYGNFPGFDGSDARGGGFSYMRYNFPNGWFVGGGGGRIGSSVTGLNQEAAFADTRSLYSQGLYSQGLYSQGLFSGGLYSQGAQFGYNFQPASGLPVTVYAGFDTLKYSVSSLFAPFDTLSSTVPGYRAHAGIEFQPASNVSLALGFGYTQQPGRIDGDINSLALSGASPFALSGRR